MDGDIGDATTAARVAETAISTLSSIDALVNNAGIFFTKPFTDYTAEDFKQLVSTNLRGDSSTQPNSRSSRCSCEKSGGSIVSITASLADMITKGGLNATTRSLAIEYAERRYSCECGCAWSS